MSSGRPLSGRGIVAAARPRPVALARRPCSFAARMSCARFSTSRTLVRYSSSLPLSAALTCRPSDGDLFPDAVEDAQVPLAAAVVEQAVERQRRIDLHRHGRVGALPRDVRAVGHREVRLVVAGDRLLAAQDQAGLHGLIAEVAGQHLIHADAAVQLRASSAAARPRGDCRSARMNADAGGRLVEQTVDVS